MKVNWCKILGHKFVPVFLIGYYGKIKVKFIGTECSRCNFGADDLSDTIHKMDNNLVCSYDEEYYK